MNVCSFTENRIKIFFFATISAIFFTHFTMAQNTNPFAGNKTAFMHDDAFSSDAFSGLAPTGTLDFSFESKSGAVPTILQGSDHLLQVICVRNESTGSDIKRTPYLLLLDPANMQTLASFKLPEGRALNNIYGYLNENDELMLANGKTIYRIAHLKSDSQWLFIIAEQFTINSVADNFEFVAITPDWKGNIWFGSYDSKAGFLNPKTGEFKILSLSDKEDEIIANSISSCPDGIAIATTHAIYVLNIKNGNVNVSW